MSKRKSHTSSSSSTNLNKKSPKTDDNYGDEEYWNSRYKNNINHTWYFDYDTLKPLLGNILHKNDSVLEIGCGDNPLCDGIVADHCPQGIVVGIDFSTKIIDTLIAKQKKSMKCSSSSSSSSSSSVLIPTSSPQSTYQYMDARTL